MDKIKTPFLIRGIPGAGKTTAAEYLAESLGASVFSADDYFYSNGPNLGKYEFDRNKLGIAHKECQESVNRYMKAHCDNVFVANTFTTQKELNPYLKLAEENEYRVISLIVENRHGNSSIHNVPSEAIKAMSDRFTVKLT